MQWRNTLLLGGLLVFSLFLRAGEPVDISRVSEFREIGSAMQYCSFPVRQDSLRNIAGLPFQPQPADYFLNRKNFNHDYYFLFSVVNRGRETDSVLFYPGVVIGSAIYHADTVSGKAWPVNDVFYYTTQVSSQQLALPVLRLAPGETRILLVRPQFRFFNFTDWRPTLVRNDQLFNLTYTYKVKPALNFLFVTIFFLGILATMFVYAMIKTYETRLREFLFYGLSTLCFLLYYFYQLTLLFNFNSWYNGLDLFMKQFLQIGAYMFYMLFASTFLNIPRHLPRLYRVMQVLYVILGAYLVFVCFTGFSDRFFAIDMLLFNAVRILLLLYSIYAVPVLFRCRVPLSRYVAYGALSVSVFAALAFYFSNVPEGYSPFFVSIGGPITLFKLGLLLELVFFTMGLAKKSQLEEGYRVKAVEMLRIENEKKEFEKFMAVMETKEKERTRIAQEIHDDIGSGLTTIRLLSEIARAKAQNGHNTEIEKISASANELIENMNQIIWSFNARNDTLPNLVAYIRRYVVGYFEPTDIIVRVQIPPEIPPLQISGDFRRTVFLVVKESIHNIMKHAGATEIKVKVEVDAGLHISIKDNGRGFNNEAVKLFSNGLRSMRERMQSIGGTFTISGAGGTEVTLHVPV